MLYRGLGQGDTSKLVGVEYWNHSYCKEFLTASMSYYQYHVFFCCNQRDDGEACCAQYAAREQRDYMKKRLKELGLHGEGQIRVNIAGCLGRCSEGPVMVVYPGETWYTYVDQDDIDEIIESHLLNHQPVERLQI
jgi:(2Fe-2S) ferredoxin